MNVNANQILKTLKEKSGTICAVTAVGGLGLTTYFSGKAAVEVKENVKPEMTTKEKVKTYAKAYWKTAISFIGTAGLIIGSDRIHVGKEAALAGAVVAWKDKFIGIEDKIKEKFGEEKAEEIKRELAEEARKKDEEKIKGIHLAEGEFVVYVPDAEQYFITTEKRKYYALYKTNEKYHKDGDVRLDYFCKKLGKPVSGFYSPTLSSIGWCARHMEQSYELSFSHDTIDYISNVYIRTDKIEDGELKFDKYVTTGNPILDSDIEAIFFNVSPQLQRYTDWDVLK